MTWQPLLLVQYVGTTTTRSTSTIHYTVQHTYFITKTIDIVFIKVLHVSAQLFISRFKIKRSDVHHYNKGELTHTELCPYREPTVRRPCRVTINRPYIIPT
jgi:hypothetical protein